MIVIMQYLTTLKSDKVCTVLKSIIMELTRTYATVQVICSPIPLLPEEIYFIKVSSVFQPVLLLVGDRYIQNVDV